MKPTRLVLLPLTALVAALVVAGAARVRAQYGRTPGPSTAVYPPQQLPVSFSHLRHLERPGAKEAGVACVTCHAAALTSTRAGDDLLPAEAACTPCHAVDRADPGPKAANCTKCHPGWDGAGEPPRVIVPPAALKFSHRLHAERKIECAACHGDFVAGKVNLATRNHLPRMATCLGCHDGKQATARCNACHLADASGTLITSLPDGELVPSGSLFGDRHDLGFVRGHGGLAARQPGYCESCHKQSFCSDCHDGQVKPAVIHPADYELAHALDARKNVPDCASCHRAQSFCTGCHARAGVVADKRTSEFAARRALEPSAPRFHPAGFEEAAHGRAAQRNLRACASCHREDFCQGCHTAEPGGAMQVSPHGAGWRASRRCRALEDKNPRLCLRCHVEGKTCDD